MQRFSREGNSIYAHFLTLVWFLWMKFVSLGIVLIVLLLSMYILLSISETQQKPIHLQFRTKMEKKEKLSAETLLRFESYADVKENPTQDVTVSEATFAG
jgi:uncharacterized membrane protein SpoIIM required for sporulation